MRKLRFFTERKNIRTKSSVLLQEFEAEHIRSTLRLSKGDEIYLFNGEKEFRAKLKLVSKGAVMAQVIEEIKVHEDKIDLHLFQGLSKAKSFEFILEKATELGVTKIIPLETEYSVIKIDEDKTPKKVERWGKIMRSAAKQSERVSIPEITEPVKFYSSLERTFLEDYDYVIFTNPGEEQNLIDFCNEILVTDKKIRIGAFIGPEGGFSPFEIEAAKKVKDIKFVSLSQNILRVETAAILAAGVIMMR
ncbi:MAG: 16S rRNA (uracil(1498)-N(3))-methyltransferase [Candidatus Dojkabacteria bacterium]